MLLYLTNTCSLNSFLIFFQINALILESKNLFKQLFVKFGKHSKEKIWEVEKCGKVNLTKGFNLRGGEKEGKVIGKS